MFHVGHLRSTRVPFAFHFGNPRAIRVPFAFHWRTQPFETINAVVDLQRAWRRCLPQCWDVAWVWRGLIESHSHYPIPDFVFLAFTALALLWGWGDVAALLLAGFLGMLRPGEMLLLEGRDLVFPSEVCSLKHMFLAIRAPKNRRIAAKREHVRLDDPEVVAFFKVVKAQLALSDRIFRGDARSFRQCFNHLCAFFDIPSDDINGLTPASLRAGGATFLYQITDQPETVRYKGRWANSRMLEIYIQEVAANTFADTLGPEQKDRLLRLARAAPSPLAAFCSR